MEKTLDIHGAGLFVTDSGGHGEPILFLHGFLFDGRQFDHQVRSLREGYRCLTLDFRGQGRSTPARGGYQIEQQTADVVAVIRQLHLPPVHLVGLSMGGFVSMRIAARQSTLVRSLTLVNTSAAPHPKRKFPKQLALAGVARVAGVSLAPIVSGIEDEMYGQAFRDDPARAGERDAWRQRWADADRASLVRTLLGFMIRPDMRAELADIITPTLIVSGGSDNSLPPTFSREMHRLISGAKYVEVAPAGHSSPLEAPEAVTTALQGFLAAL